MINIIKKILREIFSKFNGLYFLGAVDKLPAPLSKKEEDRLVEEFHNGSIERDITEKNKEE